MWTGAERIYQTMSFLQIGLYELSNDDNNDTSSPYIYFAVTNGNVIYIYQPVLATPSFLAFGATTLTGGDSPSQQAVLPSLRGVKSQIPTAMTIRENLRGIRRMELGGGTNESTCAGHIPRARPNPPALSPQLVIHLAPCIVTSGTGSASAFQIGRHPCV
jgi:hypothetical protein